MSVSLLICRVLLSHLTVLSLNWKETSCRLGPGTFAFSDFMLTVSINLFKESRLEILASLRYSLIIPPETRYSQQAGPLSEEVSVEFFGLRKFRIPFLWNMKLKKSRDRVREQDHFGFVK